MSQPSYDPTDEYGVPTEIFGGHVPDFFPLLGRIVALSSVIERNARTLAQKLITRQAHDAFSHRTSEVLDAAIKNVCRIDNESARKAVEEYLDDVKLALPRRDAYVHSLWPAVSVEHGARVVGWRIKPGTTALDLGDDLEVIREDVHRFSELVTRWNRIVLPGISSLPWLQHEGSVS